MTTVKPSPGALSQHVAGTDGVWLTRQLSKHTLVLQVVFVRIYKRCRGLYHVGVMTCVFYVCICCGVCIYNTCSQTALCRCVHVCVGVLIWCRLSTNEGACFVCHCVCDFDSLLVHPGAVVTCWLLLSEQS